MKTTNNWLKDGFDILNPRKHPVSDEVLNNMRKLCEKLQQIQDSYGHQLVCNSGYRSPEEQMKINPKAPNSWHTKGAAIDISDKDNVLWFWLNQYSLGSRVDMSNIQALDVYLEDRSATPTWVHIQIYPPKSGKRIFKP